MSTTEMFVLYGLPCLAGLAALSLYVVTGALDKRDRKRLRREQDARRELFRQAMS